jgi:Rrf2 family transcriptional regulator, cysteine metabolism repressor
MSFKITTKGRYATRAIIDLAMHDQGKPVLLRDLAEHQAVSEKYLERMMGMLVKAGLVKSFRGQKGGFGLARTPDRIRMADVIEAVEGRIQPAGCVENSSQCERRRFCATRDVWIELERTIRRSLESITVQNLIERQEGKNRMHHSRDGFKERSCQKP